MLGFKKRYNEKYTNKITLNILMIKYCDFSNYHHKANE